MDFQIKDLRILTVSASTDKNDKNDIYNTCIYHFYMPALKNGHIMLCYGVVWLYDRLSVRLKILITKASDKKMQTMQTQIRQLLRSSLIRIYTVCYSTEYFMKQMHKKQKKEI